MQFRDFSELVEFIEYNLTNEMSLEDISEFSYYSLPHIHRSLKSIMEYTLKEYIRKRRLSEAAIELVEGNYNVIDIAFKYQYNSNEAFSRAFRQMFECSPKEYRQNGVIKGLLKKYRIEGGRNLKLLNTIDAIYQRYYENPSKFNLEKELAKYVDDVVREVKECNYSKETVNFAVKVLFRIGRYEIIKDLFKEYLEYVDTLEDEDWVRYNLMMIRYNLKDNFFQGFQEYYKWMKEHIDKEQWYYAVCNASVILDFLDADKGNEFISVVNEIRNVSTSTVENRQARFETTRALVVAHLKFENYGKVEEELKIFDKISNEDKSDLNYLFNRNEYITRRIYYLDAVNEDYSIELDELLSHINMWKSRIDNLMQEYNKLFNQEYYFRSYDELRYDRSPIKGLRSVIHNAGCMYYFLGNHQEALDMFDDPMSNGYLNSYSAGLYMGSVYEVTNDTEKLLEAMKRQIRILENNPDYWKKVKELENMIDNKEFVSKVENLV